MALVWLNANAIATAQGVIPHAGEFPAETPIFVRQFALRDDSGLGRRTSSFGIEPEALSLCYRGDDPQTVEMPIIMMGLTTGFVVSKIVNAR